MIFKRVIKYFAPPPQKKMLHWYASPHATFVPKTCQITVYILLQKSVYLYDLLVVRYNVIMELFTSYES